MPERTRSMNIWFSEEEIGYVKNKADEMGLSSSAYIRYKSIYENRIKEGKENGKD